MNLAYIPYLLTMKAYQEPVKTSRRISTPTKGDGSWVLFDKEKSVMFGSISLYTIY